MVGGDLVNSSILMRDDAELASLTVQSANGQGGDVVGQLVINGIVGSSNVDSQSGSVLVNECVSPLLLIRR